MQELMFKLKKETKGAVCYQQVNADGEYISGDSALVGTLYLRKALLNDEAPQELKVTVEGVERPI